MKTDDFASTNEIKPLLHIWSLSTEEQFYCVWPTMRVGIRTFGRSWFRQLTIVRQVFLLLIAVLAAFGLAEALRLSFPKSSYFLLFVRMCKLGTGAVLAISWRRSPPSAARPRPPLAPVRRSPPSAARHRPPLAARPRPPLALGLSAAGLVLVLGSIALFTTKTPVPGFWLALPSLGAALLLIPGTGQTTATFARLKRRGAL